MLVNHIGKVHGYLGMEINYIMETEKVMFGMIKYVENMIKAFPEKLKSTESKLCCPS